VDVLVDLAGQDLAARGCGNCQGSHSDNQIRAKREDDATPAATDTMGESIDR